MKNAPKTGGPAFPEKRRINRAGYSTNDFEPVGGMTMRDYFAAAALTGIIAKGEDEMLPHNRAKEAFALADAMLTAREAS